MTTERWAPIPGFPGYEASTLGRVRSLDRFVDYVDGRRVWTRGRVLRPATHPRNGYQHVNLSGDRSRLVHGLILETFVGPRPPGLEACHGPGGPSDNRLANLRWDTSSANNLDTVQMGRHHMKSRERCPRNHRLSAPNLIAAQVKKGHRACLACSRGRNLARNRRVRAGIEVPFEPLADAYYAEIMAGREPARDRRRRTFTPPTTTTEIPR